MTLQAWLQRAEREYWALIVKEGRTVRDYAKIAGVSPATACRRLGLAGYVISVKRKWVRGAGGGR